MSDSQADVRDDWWHIMLLTPLVLPLGGKVGSVELIVIFVFAITYPVALYKDSIYVNQTFSEWARTLGCMQSSV